MYGLCFWPKELSPCGAAVTDDELALLRAIQEFPDSDLPRLVYADWLDDYGQSDRAEFIRLQIERYRQSLTGECIGGISWREYQILKKYEPLWKAELPPPFRSRTRFRRGLIYECSCRIAAFFNNTQPIVPPIESIVVLVDELRAEWIVQPPRTLHYPFRELSIRCLEPVGRTLAETLVRFGPYPHLQTLQLSDISFDMEGLQALRALPAFPAVRHLHLWGCNLNLQAIPVLIENGWMDQLEKLSIPRNFQRNEIAEEALQNRFPHIQFRIGY